MKLIRQIALTTMLTIGAFSVVTYTSCNKDKCKDVVCNNGGTCNTTDGTCSCKTGYEGADCGTLTRAKFVGSWTGTDYCTNPSDTVGINLTVGTATNDVQATVTNAGGFGSTVTITGTVTATNIITFTGQSVATGVSLSGTITLNTSNTMTFAYTVVDNTGTQTCSGNYTKL